MTCQVRTVGGDDELFIKAAFALGSVGALLQLMVFDCPISSTSALPLSSHPRRCHIQQSRRTSHSLPLSFEKHSLRPPLLSYPSRFLSRNRVESSPSRDCPFLRAPSAFNLPHYRSTSSDSLAGTPIRGLHPYSLLHTRK